MNNKHKHAGHIITIEGHSFKSNESGMWNLTEIWKLNKKERIIINLSGIYLQFFVGILLFIFFILTKNQITLHLFYSNFIISIINLNPILKFDGYWFLSDFLEKSNLIIESNDYF